MESVAILEMKVDVQLAFDSMGSKERKEFISDNLDECYISVLMAEVARRCDIEETINSFREDEIEEWLDCHAEEYGYIKNEDL